MKRTYAAFTLALLALAGSVGAVPASDSEPTAVAPAERIAGYTHEEALRHGERMYREGILPDGSTFQAVVQGGIQVESDMFTCENCHLRSGIGSEEGGVITLPTHAVWLFTDRNPLSSLRMIGDPRKIVPNRETHPQYVKEDLIRPAYDDETLARVLRTGLNPAGKKLGPTMPRYFLDDEAMAVLIHYLHNLSAAFSPGVSPDTVRFGTVISEDLTEAEKLSMLEPLQAHIDIHNKQWRAEKRREEGGPWYRQEANAGFVNWALDVWLLKGERSTWPAQLEEYNRTQPVFALLGGRVSGSWEPVHAFSETHRVPSIFPVTDKPVITDTDWYTLYFDKGRTREGETAAKWLRKRGRLPEGARVVQLYRTGTDGEEPAGAFRDIWSGSRRVPALQEIALAPGDEITKDLWGSLAGEGPLFLVSWVGREDVPKILALEKSRPSAEALYFSWGMLGQEVVADEELRNEKVFLTWPRILPQDAVRKQLVLGHWLRARKIPERDLAVQGRMYYLTWITSMAFSNLRNLWYRDYLLDSFDMMGDRQGYSSLNYPQISYGPGQRYGSKSCYIVQLKESGDAGSAASEVVPVSEPVVH